MNDDHALTVIKDRLAEVRDSLGEVYPSIPASEIVARARRSHVRRRLIPGMAGVLALAGAAALALTTLVPASHQASPRPRVQLAAWTVVTSLAALSQSPSASCAIRPDCNAGSAPTGYRPPSPSSASKTRRVTHGRAPL